MKLPTLAELRKTVVTVLGVAATLLAAGMIPAPAAHIVSIVLAAATVLGVYAVPNGQRRTVDTGPGSTTDATPPAAPAHAAP